MILVCVLFTQAKQGKNADIVFQQCAKYLWVMSSLLHKFFSVAMKSEILAVLS